MKQRKIPMRMCIACRTSRPKRELIRIVKTGEGSVEVDQTGKVPGRGAYICSRIECLENAYKSKALSRALDMNMTPEMLESLRRIILRRELGI